ncbi:MAG: bifunctional UDP-sugar hydrolase/5'-nucleotidase [Crocinitomicaceae bacterium]
MNRRQFLNSVLIGTAGYSLVSASKAKIKKLTILHTNDTHSRIDPFPDNDSNYPGQGGIFARQKAIEKVKAESDHVLLLDAGDIFQGTPYFNLYGGKVELEAMSALGYDAATMGNHDFDGGLDGFKKALKFARFPFICSNYDFSKTVLKNKTIPYKIIRKGKLKIGILGIGVALDGLVSPELFQETVYQDPFTTAQKYANLLRHDLKCNLVICLSHLGYKQPNQIDDINLAKITSSIDLIIGGHSHTFMTKPEYHINKIGKQVLINQAGWAGLQLGKIELYFNEDEENQTWSNHSTELNITV